MRTAKITAIVVPVNLARESCHSKVPLRAASTHRGVTADTRRREHVPEVPQSVTLDSGRTNTHSTAERRLRNVYREDRHLPGKLRRNIPI